MSRKADQADSIFITGNKYGYKVNVNHPQIQPLYERFKEKMKTPILSDRQRFYFENIIISMFGKNHDNVQREDEKQCSEYSQRR